MKNIKHVLKAIASGLIPGLGQVLNKQIFKAIFFFVIFAGFVSIELGTSKYFTGYDPYTDVLEVKTASLYNDEFFKELYSSYLYDKNRGLVSSKSFEDYYQQINDGKENPSISTLQVIEFLSKDLKENNTYKYYNLLNFISDANKYQFIERDSDIAENDELVNSFSLVPINCNTYYNNVSKKEYVELDETDPNGNKVYANILNRDEQITSVEGLTVFERGNTLYTNKAGSGVYVSAKLIKIKDDGEEVKTNIYINLIKGEYTTTAPSGVALTEKAGYPVKGDVYMTSDKKLYVHYTPGINGVTFTDTSFSSWLKEYIGLQYIKPGNTYTGTQAVRFYLQTYFAINDQAREKFIKDFDNFYHDRAGFFLKGIWSVITLGQTDKANYTQHCLLLTGSEASTLGISGYLTSIPILGHVTSNLLIIGIIAMLIAMYFLFFHVWSIRDAYKTSKEYSITGEKVSSKVWFKNVYEHGFEYIVLSPALFVITFISIMPILFGFLIAFTSYSGYSADLGRSTWVGFDNFINIFSFGNTGSAPLPFGQMFWKVLFWTIIWAILSTVTVFFGGFFQAIIISNEHVPFKKFWRTLLILPWAVPAIISQMVFSVIFVDQGVLNTFLESVGIYDLFKSWGILGVPFNAEEMNLFQRLFYTGWDNIQWFTNPSNKWFVRMNLVIVNIWLGFPYYMALMSGIMTSIDKTLFEAADIDGASKWQKFKFITFPLVLQSTAPLLVMCFSGNFNNFGVIYFITQGGNNADNNLTAFAGDTDILISWMYRLTVDKKVYNFASVFSILIFIFVGSVAAWNYSRTKAFKED